MKQLPLEILVAAEASVQAMVAGLAAQADAEFAGDRFALVRALKAGDRAVVASGLRWTAPSTSKASEAMGKAIADEALRRLLTPE